MSEGSETIYINGITNTTSFPSGTVFSGLTDGTYNITIVAVDEARNVGIATIIFTINSSSTTTVPTTITSTEPKLTSTTTTITTTAGASNPGVFFILLLLCMTAIFHRQRKNKGRKILK